MNTKFFLQEAMKQSLKSEMNHKHGCVIVKNGKIVSTGHNHYVLKADKSKGKFSIHAEEDAIKKYCKMYPRGSIKQNNIQIYVVRCNHVHGEVQFKNSKPCKNCSNLITYLDPSRVIYSVDNNKALVEFL